MALSGWTRNPARTRGSKRISWCRSISGEQRAKTPTGAGQGTGREGHTRRWPRSSSTPPGERLPTLGDRLEETTILGAAMTEAPDAYVRDLMAPHLVVAGRAAGQVEVRARLAPATLHDLRQALVRRSTDREADLRSRIDAGLALGRLGDPRFEARDARTAGPVPRRWRSSGTLPMANEVSST